MRKLIDKLINRLGKRNYTVDNRISRYELFLLIFSKFIAMARGIFLKLRFKKAEGLVFAGKNCKIRFCHKIKAGRTLILGDNVQINALSSNGIVFGNNVSVNSNTIIECTGTLKQLGEGLVTGNNVGIAQNCFIQVRGNVKIGSDVIFGPGVHIFSENHGFSDMSIPIMEQPSTRKGVTIEDNVWVGSRAVILDGVTVGQGSIIASGTIVNIDVPPFSIAAGVPARIIKSRK